jgi:hypothetical protein
MLAAGDVLWLQAAYADGALSYIGVNNLGLPLLLASPDQVLYSTGAGVGYGVSSKAGKGWNLTAALLHYWTPTIRQGLFGTYTDVQQANPLFYDVTTGLYGTNFSTDYKYWAAGTNLIWSPVSGLDIGGEVGYQNLDPSGRVTVFEDGAFAVTKSNVGQWYGRLRIQRDF